jgi:hypothetical protein
MLIDRTLTPFENHSFPERRLSIILHPLQIIFFFSEKMKLLSWVPLLAAAQNSPTDEWVIDGLSLSCGFETPTILSFDIYPGQSVSINIKKNLQPK